MAMVIGAGRSMASPETSCCKCCQKRVRNSVSSFSLRTEILGTWWLQKRDATLRRGEVREKRVQPLNVLLVNWNVRLATRVAVGEIHVPVWKDKESELEGDLIRLV